MFITQPRLPKCFMETSWKLLTHNSAKLKETFHEHLRNVESHEIEMTPMTCTRGTASN